MEQNFKQDIELYASQEESLQFTSFNNEDAWELGCLMAKRAEEANAVLSMDIFFRGQQLFRCARTGTQVKNDNWIRRKINTVLHAQKSSLHFGTLLHSEGKVLEDVGLTEVDYVDCGGGFPLIIKGEGVVGVITVSGLPHLEDHQFIVDTLTEYFKTH